jgi:hypothetical protein
MSSTFEHGRENHDVAFAFKANPGKCSFECGADDGAGRHRMDGCFGRPAREWHSYPRGSRRRWHGVDRVANGARQLRIVGRLMNLTGLIDTRPPGFLLIAILLIAILLIATGIETLWTSFRHTNDAGDGASVHAAPFVGAAAASTCASSDPEHRDRRFQVARLLMQRCRGSGRLLHERRVLLGHFIHLDNGLIHLLDTRALFKR